MRKIRITKNTIELLKTIYEFRYIPLKALIDILAVKGIYSKLPSLTRIILNLEKNGLLKSFVYGNNWKVVYITHKSAILLSESLLYYPREILPPNQGKKIKFAGLEHTVSIIEIYLKLLQNFNIRTWLGDQNVFCPYSFRSNKSGKTIKHNLSPDGYFEIQINNKNISFFLEYDSGSMDTAQLALKFKRYFEYFTYGDWKERYITFPNIFFITERSEKSMSKILQNPTEEDLEKALINRENLTKAPNVLWKGIGMTENIKSINSQFIRDFLSLKFIFSYIQSEWKEDLKKQLY